MALLMGGSLLLGGCGSNGAQDAVETSAVVVDMKQAQTGKLTLQNSFVGTVSPQEMVYVIPFASGTVTDTYFEVGDQVNAGDVLFKIDDSAAKLQLEQAQLSAANVRQQADSALTTQQESANIQMDSSRVQAQSGYDQAQIAYVQAKNAYDQNYDDLSDQIDACNANITQLENAIKAASSSVSGGNASSERNEETAGVQQKFSGGRITAGGIRLQCSKEQHEYCGSFPGIVPGTGTGGYEEATVHQ